LKQSYVLDTGVLLNLVRGKEVGTRIDREFALTSSMRLHTVSIVTHGELKVLSERNDWGAEKRNALAVALDNLVTVNIESEALVEATCRWTELAGIAAAAAGPLDKTTCGLPRLLYCPTCRSLLRTRISSRSMSG
jgi:hypothetical protein